MRRMRVPEHEKLIVYQRAVDATMSIERVVVDIPAARGDLKDQLRRAALSIPLNIAEGAGEFSRPEKDRFYRMARRSSSECLAALDIVGKLFPAVVVAPARAQLLDVSAMLTRMVTRRT